MSYTVGDNFSLQGQESDGEDLIQFSGVVNLVNQETFAVFLDSTETPREYSFQYYEIRVNDGILYYKHTVDLLIDGVDWVPEYSIPVEQARKILHEFMNERNKYAKDPLDYKLTMLKNGARCIVDEDYRSENEEGALSRFTWDTSRVYKDAQNSPNGVVRIETNEEKAELLKKLHTLN